MLIMACLKHGVRYYGFQRIISFNVGRNLHLDGWAKKNPELKKIGEIKAD